MRTEKSTVYKPGRELSQIPTLLDFDLGLPASGTVRNKISII